MQGSPEDAGRREHARLLMIESDLNLRIRMVAARERALGRGMNRTVEIWDRQIAKIDARLAREGHITSASE